ncbi:MAG: lipase/acyltransferase domain-containing protein, partial [Algoriphagus sp.]
MAKQTYSDVPLRLFDIFAGPLGSFPRNVTGSDDSSWLYFSAYNESGYSIYRILGDASLPTQYSLVTKYPSIIESNAILVSGGGESSDSLIFNSSGNNEAWLSYGSEATTFGLQDAYGNYLSGINTNHLQSIDYLPNQPVKLSKGLLFTAKAIGSFQDERWLGTQTFLNQSWDSADPLSASIATSLYFHDNERSSFSRRVKGQFTVPYTSDRYRLYLSSDSQAKLYFSETQAPDNYSLIASIEPGQSAPWKAYRKYPNQKSQALYLEAGKQYFIKVESMHQESDYLSVGIGVEGTEINDNSSIPTVYELNMGHLPNTHQLWVFSPGTNRAKKLTRSTVALPSVTPNPSDANRNDVIIKSVYSQSSAPEGLKGRFEIIRNRKRMRTELFYDENVRPPGETIQEGFALSGTGPGRLRIGTDPSYTNMSTIVEISADESFRRGLEWKKSTLLSLQPGQTYYLEAVCDDGDISNLAVGSFSRNDSGSGASTDSGVRTVSLAIVDPTQPVTWEVIGIGDDPATASDFSPSANLGGTVNVSRSYTFDVPFNNDNIAETDKTFAVKITNSPRDATKISEAQFTIIDDDLLDIEQLVDGNGSAFFLARDGLGKGIWMTDGTAKGTKRVFRGNVLQLKSVGSSLVFITGDDSSNKQKLCYADTSSLASNGMILPVIITESLKYDLLSFLDNSLLYNADSIELLDDEEQRVSQLFFLESLSAQPRLIDPNAPSKEDVCVAGNYFYYVGSSGSLYATDGESTTVLVSDHNTRGIISSDKVGGANSGENISQLTAVGNDLYFTASTPRYTREFFDNDDNIYTTEIWKSDGTRAGTHVAFEIRHDGEDPDPEQLKGIGDTLFFTADDGLHGRELFAFQTEERRRPIFILPGIGAVFPDSNSLFEWTTNRGFDPKRMIEDFVYRTYDDLIQTLENVGYERGKDLFVIAYDWRLPPGPLDKDFDGWLNGISADSISDETYQYSVDYLGEALAEASKRWKEEYGENLGEVDIIGHSTGGLVARSYIQSDAYGGRLQNGNYLPQVKNLITFSTPQRGAPKALNPINNNWSVDSFYKVGFRYINKGAYRAVMSGNTINAPIDSTWGTGPITKERLVGSKGNFQGDYNGDGLEGTSSDDLNRDGLVDEIDAKIFFLYQYNPTAKVLLSTYLTQQELPLNGRPLSEGVNAPDARNMFLVDLNGSLDFSVPGETLYDGFPGFNIDVNFWTDSIGQLTAIYGTNNQTPTSIVRRVGPIYSDIMIMGSRRPEKNIYSFGDDIWPEFGGRAPRLREVWYEDILTQEGDGTVPLESLQGLFLRFPKDNIALKLFTKDVNTEGSTEHSGLLSNRDALRAVLEALDLDYDEQDISTDLYTGNRGQLIGLFNSKSGDWLAANDSVRQFLYVAFNAIGTIGYSRVGVSFVLPGSSYVPALSTPQAELWVVDEKSRLPSIKSGPPELQLTGMGSDYDISISGRYLNHEFTLHDSGFLGEDQKKTIPLNFPVVVDDQVSGIAGTSIPIQVLANDTPSAGKGIEIHEYQGSSEKGGFIGYNRNNTTAIADDYLIYTPTAGFKGLDSFYYKAISGETVSLAKVTINVLNDDLPVIRLAVAPAAGVSEDGSSNLIYTFSRTGSTSTPLSVNYGVGGSASLGTDYTGIAGT